VFEIRLTPQAENVYTQIDSKTRERIDHVFENFEQGNLQHRNIRSLHGQYRGSLRYRLGKWRIIFRVNHTEEIIWIEAITTRGGAYR